MRTRQWTLEYPMIDKEFQEALGQVIEYARTIFPDKTDVLVVAHNRGRDKTHCGTTNLDRVRGPLIIEALAEGALDAIKQRPSIVTVQKKEDMS